VYSISVIHITDIQHSDRSAFRTLPDKADKIEVTAEIWVWPINHGRKRHAPIVHYKRSLACGLSA